MAAGSRDNRRGSFFNLQSRQTLCHTDTHCRGRRVQSPPSPFRRTIPGRHRDESKLCLTNTLVLFSLHGKLARTADIIRSKTIFFLNISLPPSQADVHSYSSLVYPIRVVRQLQSIWRGFLYFVKGMGSCSCAYLYVHQFRVFVHVPLNVSSVYESVHVRVSWGVCIHPGVYVCVQVTKWNKWKHGREKQLVPLCVFSNMFDFWGCREQKKASAGLKVHLN